MGIVIGDNMYKRQAITTYTCGQYVPGFMSYYQIKREDLDLDLAF